MKKILVIGVATSTVAFASGNFAIGPKLSTLGIGLEASYKAADMFALRGGINYFSYSKNLSKSMSYKGKLRLMTLGFIGDFHPFKNGFAISLGAMYNCNRLDLSATPVQNQTINGQVFTPAQLGTVKGELTFRKIAPYVGLRYDSAFYNDSPWSFNAEIGIFFQGGPKAKIKSITGLAQNVAADIETIRQDAQKSASRSWIKNYPVVGFGFKYRF